MDKHILCIPTGEQRGYQRFPKGTDAPLMKAWRCDLTALSQQYNLYFVACDDAVYVYQPSFPNQNLSSIPSLILHPPESSKIGPGIDWDNSHSITRILVDYLGTDEILLLTCDDGDVLGYRVSGIHRAVEKQVNQVEPADDDEVVPIFLNLNVGASAWGLAVHREARIIAISANTHKITVIAYALTNAVDPAEASDSDDYKSLPSRQEVGLAQARDTEQIVTLEADSNIPALSFNNNGEDRSGRWLFSSCISGKTILWDLLTLQPAKVYQIGWCASQGALLDAPVRKANLSQCICTDRDIAHVVWGTIMFDTRSAYKIAPTEEHSLQSKDITSWFRDVSAQKNRFGVQERKPYPTNMLWNEVEDDLTDMEIDEEEILEPRDSPKTENGSDAEDSSYMTPPGIQAFDDVQQQHPLQAIFEQLDADLMEELSFDGYTKPQIKQPYCSVSHCEQEEGGQYHFMSKKPASPFLILSKEEIFLIQQPFLPTNTECSPTNLVSMRRPLQPGPWKEVPGAMDRHAFFSQIPELAVFIIASPVGRAGVFTLYWTQDEGAERPQYGFQLEYLLPFRRGREEKVAGGPANGWLVGVAVGPVQGVLDKQGDEDASEREGGLMRPRRWRVLMYYMDHSVLSFELSKRRMDEPPGLGDLVV
ncbi:hypothetical protein BDW02DRAFT_574341 [Decorospora gaudefroyi]|uniref:Uncharacterized protein n=1 Tax=Decorospora gaudefroyi TaxID=184978 RepID=A0A6A5K3I8_9PLEO|nr:hypothetical protein BDW02DRAFT_574341 [Decorospora gaudefroyi]